MKKRLASLTMLALLTAACAGMTPMKTNAQKCVDIGGVYTQATHNCLLPPEPATK